MLNREIGNTAIREGRATESFTDFGLGDLFQEIFGGGRGGMGWGWHGRLRGSFRQKGGSPFAQRGNDLQTSIQVPFLHAAGGREILELSDGRRLTVKIPVGIHGRGQR